jgi:nicotinate-nucleotide adenylyltransferase
MRQIGIMGGTFNPIHVGHLAAAEQVYERLGLEKVIFVPSYTPPHKEQSEVAHPWHRYTMVVLATLENEHFFASDLEIKRKGISYTEETIKEFKHFYGEQTEIYFIVGYDTVPQLDTWKNIEKLLESCTFIAVSRPGYRRKKHKWQQKVHWFPIEGFGVSSTLIRKRVREGKSIRYLVPKAVEEYIRKYGLYR